MNQFFYDLDWLGSILDWIEFPSKTNNGASIK